MLRRLGCLVGCSGGGLDSCRLFGLVLQAGAEGEALLGIGCQVVLLILVIEIHLLVQVRHRRCSQAMQGFHRHLNSYPSSILLLEVVV